MTDQIEDLIGQWAKYISTGALAVVAWLGGNMLNEIKDNQKMSSNALVGMLVQMSTIKEQMGARSIESLHQAAQIEDVRTQLIDLRMRVNTIEQREAAKK